MFTVYILKTSGNTLYIGQTKDLKTRLHHHKNKTKQSAKYLRPFSSFELVYTELLETRSLALKREIALKKLSRLQKDALVSKFKK